MNIVFFAIDICNTFNELLYESIYTRCKKYGYTLYTVYGGRLNAKSELEKRKNIIYQWMKEKNKRKQIDFIIMENMFDFIRDEEAQEFLQAFNGIPIITLSKRLQNTKSILIENRCGLEILINQLIQEQGCRNFAVLAGPPNNYDSIERLATVQQTLQQNNLLLDSNKIYYGTFSFSDGIEGVTELLDKRNTAFDALICLNDSMAIGAIKELKRRNFAIPEEIKVTGFDNTWESFFIMPALSTVNYPIVQAGYTAIDLAKDFFSGKEIPEITYLPTYAIPRNSTKLRMEQSLLPLHQTKNPNIHPYIQNNTLYEISKENIRLFIQEVLAESAAITTEPEKEWFITTFTQIIENILHHKSTIQEQKPSLNLDFTKEWSYPLIMDMINKSMALLNQQIQVRNQDLFLKQIQKELEMSLFKLYYYYSSSIIQSSIYSKITEEFLSQLGEELNTAFDYKIIADLLAKHLPQLGIRKCFIVIYSNEEKNESRLVGHIEDGVSVPVSHFPVFATYKVLPQELLNDPEGLFMEALHVKEEDIGFVLFNHGYKYGTILKNLRHQISAALKGTALIQTIHQYSNEMEQKVIERTKELEETNQQLKEEIKKREKAERSLLKNKNLESLGLLAGGIAHDFNNYLTGILANISLMQMGHLSEEEKNNCINDVEIVTKNAIGLTQQLLTFSRGGSPIKQNTSIVPLIQEISRFLLRGSSIRTEFHFADNIKNILIDREQISQVLHNLLLNSIHAMDNKGIITIEAELKTLDKNKEHESFPFLKAGEYLVITIRDNGSGIDEAIIDKIFDPYFTTRQEGSGLGLAISLTIMRKHGGDITVTSKKGKGSCFTLYLPVENPTEKKPAQISQAIETPTTKLRILVLEDDSIILKVLTKMLHLLGHECTVTTYGEETIACFQQAQKEGKSFDLLILDLTIVDGKGGIETIQEIREKDKNVKAVVSSGYSEIPVMGEFRKYGFNAILQKPYTIKELEEVIHSLEK